MSVTPKEWKKPAYLDYNPFNIILTVSLFHRRHGVTCCRTAATIYVGHFQRREQAAHQMTKGYGRRPSCLRTHVQQTSRDMGKFAYFLTSHPNVYLVSPEYTFSPKLWRLHHCRCCAFGKSSLVVLRSEAMREILQVRSTLPEDPVDPKSQPQIRRELEFLYGVIR